MPFWSRRRVGLPDDWRARAVQAVTWFDPLVETEQELVGALADRLLREKHWEAAGGMVVTDDVRLTIALQASLLVLGLSYDHLRMASTIIVYPSTIVSRREVPGPAGTRSSGPTYLLGEASHGRGPVVVAWDTAEHNARHPHQGHDVVLHEFAHKIDMLDGLADGAPRHSSRIDQERWQRVCTAEYQAIRARREADRSRAMVATALGEDDPVPVERPVIRDYAGTDPSEFFAVVTELFFTTPIALRDHNAELYDVFADYYRQDPASLPT
jgi:Mlc titration factor MtfA (ptsG expression regulator)